MLFKKNKISSTLKSYIEFDYYSSYRILVKFKKFHKNFDSIINRLGGSIIHSFDFINLLCIDLTPKGVYRLLEYPEVSYISMDENCFLCGGSISNINGITLENTYNLHGQNIKIALIDTGTFPHPDLMSNRSILEFRDLLNDYKYPYDDNGHGTAISTAICGSGLGSKSKFKGIADKSTLISYKVFNQNGKAYFSDILRALEMLIKDTDTFDIKLLCMPFESFNTPIEHIHYFDELLKKIISKGITPIMPSGSNTGKSNKISGLANTPSAIVVSGTDNNLALYRYSSTDNKHRKVNISAKCTNVNCGNTITSYISQRDDQKIYPPKLKELYKAYSGTSISTAYICGICALLLEKYPNYTFHDIVSRIDLCSENISTERSSKKILFLDIKKFLS